jgi:hypothetical protein
MLVYKDAEDEDMASERDDEEADEDDEEDEEIRENDIRQAASSKR